MKKVFIAIILIILAVFLIVVFNLLNRSSKILSNAEKEAAIAEILGRKPNLTDNTPTGNKVYKSKYISFIYPAKAKIYTYREPNIAKNSSVLDIFSFDISSPRLIFNYSLIQYTNLSGVSDIPDVKLRQLENNLYIQDDAYADDIQGLVFEKTEGIGSFEKTALFLLNGKSYSFSIQGSDIKEVRSLYNQIISSVKFL